MPRYGVRDETDQCTNCGAVNSIDCSVCCLCRWNVSEHRPATIEEIEHVLARVDGAIQEMDRALGEADDKLREDGLQ